MGTPGTTKQAKSQRMEYNFPPLLNIHDVSVMTPLSQCTLELSGYFYVCVTTLSHAAPKIAVVAYYRYCPDVSTKVLRWMTSFTAEPISSSEAA